MENEMDVWCSRLHNRTYRQLQHLAKSLELPSNFKKVYLVSLIYAKKFKSNEEVCKLLYRIKQERHQQSKSKKRSQRRRSQIPKSSCNISDSPSITVTPKRPSRTYSDLHPAVFAINPKRSLLQQINRNRRVTNNCVSDRVLRSFNLRTLKQDYALINDNVQKYHLKYCTEPRETTIKIITNDRGISQLNITAKCCTRKVKSSITSNIVDDKHFILSSSMNLPENQALSKHQPTVSAIYPKVLGDTISIDLDENSTSPGVWVQKTDGSLTKINAVVQKNNSNSSWLHNNSVDGNVSDNLEFTDRNNNNYGIQYSNTSNLQHVVQSNNYEDVNIPEIPVVYDSKKNDFSDSMYYNNKGERFQNLRIILESEKLPKINDAFTKFNNVYRSDLIEPLNVNISMESDTSEDHSVVTNSSTLELENLYNISNCTPFLEKPKSADTICVYSTTTAVSSTMQPSTIPPPNDALNVTSSQAYEYQDIDSNLYEFELIQSSVREKYNQNGDFHGSSSLVTYEPTVDEMVEDAFEIISQDGDYMERMGMHTCVQCVICPWAGPKLLIECHIRKEHKDQILKVHKNEWNITYTLESLMTSEFWLSQIIEYDTTLYVLSAKFDDPGNLVATLSSISPEPESVKRIGSVTIYNKINGDSFSWSGYIQALPQYLPYENSLKVDLCNLDLLPNSANLDGELLRDSSSKLDLEHLKDVHIILFIKIYK